METKWDLAVSTDGNDRVLGLGVCNFAEEKFSHYPMSRASLRLALREHPGVIGCDDVRFILGILNREAKNESHCDEQGRGKQVGNTIVY